MINLCESKKFESCQSGQKFIWGTLGHPKEGIWKNFSIPNHEMPTTAPRRLLVHIYSNLLTGPKNSNFLNQAKNLYEAPLAIPKKESEKIFQFRTRKCPQRPLHRKNDQHVSGPVWVCCRSVKPHVGLVRWSIGKVMMPRRGASGQYGFGHVVLQQISCPFLIG